MPRDAVVSPVPAAASDTDRAAATGQKPANDATEAHWDRHDLGSLVDALAEYAADLLADGRLERLVRAHGPEDPINPKIPFTTPIPPSIKK